MRSLFFVLCAGCSICLLAGCAKQPSSVSVSSVPAPSSQTTLAPSQSQSDPGVGVVIGGDDFAPAQGDPVDDDAKGAVRIPYEGNESTVRYITSASQLPDNEELAGYDDAYFQQNALVLVTESVNSGSIEVAIDSIRQTDRGSEVVLYHSRPEESQATTDDMATWLLWAEVETGKEGIWTVANPALPNTAVKY